MFSLSDSEPENTSDNELDLLLLDSNSNSAASSATSSSPSKKNTKPRKTNEERLKLKEEKQKALQEKARIREEKKKEAEALKRLKPGECIKYMNVLLDSDLVNCKFSGELLVALQSAGIEYKVEKLKISRSVLFKRKLEDYSDQIENQLLIIWEWKDLVNSITSDGLKGTAQQFKDMYPNFIITLVIYGIEEYFRFQKTSKNRQLKSILPNEERGHERNKKKEERFQVPFYNRVHVEKCMIKLQLLFELQYRFIDSSQDLALLVTQFTKSLAELPFKLDKTKKQECTDWFAMADSKDSIRVDSNGNGLLSLWQQQICQFPSVGLDVAQSIVSEYPSPQILMRAYDRCSNRQEAELLLQDIQIRRSHGPLTSSRRIGQELSKKMFLFFNNLDGNVTLSQEA